MNLNPYLHFKGQCEEAFKFYEKCLGAKIEVMIPFEGTPAAEQAPAEWRKKIMHARLMLNGQALMGSDPPPAYYQKPEGFSVAINVKDAGEAERIFASLSVNAMTIKMPIQQTFWAVRFGMLVDRFGIPWMVNCEAD